MKAKPIVYDMQNDICIVNTETGIKIMYSDVAQTGDSYIKSAGVSVDQEGIESISGIITLVPTNEYLYQITTDRGALSLTGNVAGIDAYEGKIVNISGFSLNKRDAVSGESVFDVRNFK